MDSGDSKILGRVGRWIRGKSVRRRDERVGRWIRGRLYREMSKENVRAYRSAGARVDDLRGPVKGCCPIKLGHPDPSNSASESLGLPEFDGSG